MQSAARNLTFAVLLLGVVITLSIMAYAAQGDSLFSPVMLGFAAWAMAPYLLLFYSTRFLTSARVSWVIFVSILAIVCLGVFIYIDAFFIHLDPQSGLVFIFIPIYQLILSGIILIVASISNSHLRVSKKPTT